MIALPPLKWGSITLRSRYLLAPLAGYTNLPYRLAVRRVGGLGLATTDLINARALITGSKKTLDLIKTCDEDRPLAVQIYGTSADEMAEAARWLQDYGATSVDVNMGCPVKKVTRNGGGSAMMCDRLGTVRIIEKVVNAIDIPLSVKMRLGWDDDTLSAPMFARDFEKAGVAAVIVHGRTREQGFSGAVKLDGIRAVVDAVENVPIIGNGDVRSAEDAERMLTMTGCAGIAIGRGSLLNPWIFTQLENWERTGDVGVIPTFRQRVEFMVQHFELLMIHKEERHACLTFRKFGAWYCKLMHPGKQIRQKLTQLEGEPQFYEIVEELRQTPRYLNDEPWTASDVEIKVPSGPISHW